MANKITAYITTKVANVYDRKENGTHFADIFLLERNKKAEKLGHQYTYYDSGKPLYYVLQRGCSRFDFSSENLEEVVKWCKTDDKAYFFRDVRFMKGFLKKYGKNLPENFVESK